MNIEKVSEDTLKCDNENCDYVVSVPMAEWSGWIDKPCPKCGENLLTLADYHNAENVMAMADFINSLSEDELKTLAEVAKINNLVPNDEIGEKIKALNDEDPEQPVMMSISTHKEIKISDIKKAIN